MEPIKHIIYLADDHEIMLDGLTSIIHCESDMQVAGKARNGHELITLVEKQIPELCIVDIDMPLMNGLQAAEILIKKHEGIKVLILSMYKENSLLKRVRNLGVKGYVLKTCDSDELIFAIRQILKGKTYFTEGLFLESQIMQEVNANEVAIIAQLTKRELELIKFLCKGYTNTKIASILCISPSTVDNHRSNIMKKLNVHNVVELTRFCLNYKLV